VFRKFLLLIADDAKSYGLLPLVDADCQKKDLCTLVLLAVYPPFYIGLNPNPKNRIELRHNQGKLPLECLCRVETLKTSII
jgi:hypothetical protein